MLNEISSKILKTLTNKTKTFTINRIVFFINSYKKRRLHTTVFISAYSIAALALKTFGVLNIRYKFCYP